MISAHQTLPPVCIIGSSGFLGTKLLEACKLYSSKVIGLSRRGGDYYFDIEKPCLDGIPLSDVRYAFITAGITRLGQCEETPDISYVVNVQGTLQLISLLMDKKIHPIFFSSDCVFDGERGQYVESDVVSPINVYGQQKVEVEKKMQQFSSHEFTIIRTSKIYSCEEGDGTLLDEIIKNLQSKKEISLAYDQIFSPIHIQDLLTAIFYLLDQNICGIIHISGSQSISRYHLGLLIASIANLDERLIKRISLDDLNESFKRPKNTSLHSERLNTIMAHFYPILIEDSIQEYMN